MLQIFVVFVVFKKPSAHLKSRSLLPPFNSPWSIVTSRYQTENLGSFIIINGGFDKININDCWLKSNFSPFTVWSNQFFGILFHLFPFFYSIWFDPTLTLIDVDIIVALLKDFSIHLRQICQRIQPHFSLMIRSTFLYRLYSICFRNYTRIDAIWGPIPQYWGRI